MTVRIHVENVGSVEEQPEGHVTIRVLCSLRGDVELIIPDDEMKWLAASIVELRKSKGWDAE